MKKLWITRMAAAASIAAMLASDIPLPVLAETNSSQEETAADTVQQTESETDTDVSETGTLESETEMDTETETETESETETEVHQITGFVGLSESEKNYTVSYYNKPSEDEVIAMLPETIEVYLDNQSEPTEIPVTWENPVADNDYSTTDYFYYEYDAVWDTTQYELATDQEVPYVWVNLDTSLGEGEEIVGTGSVTGNGIAGTTSVFKGKIASSSSLLLAAASTSTSSTESAIYTYLTETMGLNTAAACGILANIEAESGFNTDIYGDSGTSYGLCQWHAERFTALKAYTSDYKSVSGQMSYLYHELQTSYSGVLNYLKNVSNDASGAYDAGYYWCYYFEVPANRSKVAQVRGNRASQHFWPEYSSQATNGSSDSSTSTVESLQITGETKPGDLSVGQSFSVQGTIASNTRITQVTVGVYDESGTQVIGASASPNSTVYTLSNLDNSIRFGSLQAGTYTYKVTATDENETKTLVETSFKVIGTEITTDNSEIAITGVTKPSDLTTGEGFSIRGVISSDSTISSVTVGVYNAAGEEMISASAQPNSKSYDISKLDYDVKFGTLAAGTYVYKVIATDEQGTHTLVEAYFTETASSSASKSSLTISNYSQPTTITEGSGFPVTGTIKSSSRIKSASVSIVDDSGETVINASASPNTTTYNLLALDSKVRFGTLSAGDYNYQVTAANDDGAATLVDVSFTVKSNKVEGLSVSDLVKPESFTAGGTTSIGGTVTSGSKITNVTAAVYDASGDKVISAVSNPNATSYNIGSLSSQLKFDTLSAGEYTFRLSATDQNGTQTLAESTFTVKKADTGLKITDYTAPTELTVGNYFIIKGKITSDTKITNVKIGVYNASGKEVIGASASPNKTSYNLSALDWKVKFGKLSEGSYTYRVTATNSIGTKTLVEQTFTEKQPVSEMKLTSYTAPNSLTVGNYFILRGYITSNTTIKSVTAGVYDSSGKQVIGYTAHPNTKSYSLAKLDMKVKFGKLSAGSYTYKVIAEDACGTQTLLSHTFTETVQKEMKLTSYTKPVSLHVGNGFSVQGRVSSGSKITKVTVGIYDSNGNGVIVRTAHPNTTYYYLENLDHRIKFGTLKKGTYWYKVTATDANGTETLLNTKFTEK